MPDDIVPVEPEFSLRDYLDLLRRRRAVVIQTFVVVFVLGVLFTLGSRPVYRASSRVLVESADVRSPQGRPGDTLNDVFEPPPNHDVQTQLEVLLSSEVLNPAFAKAGIVRKGVTVRARQVGDTDVLEIDVDSRSPEHALAIAKVVPAQYSEYVASSRQRGVKSALTYTEDALKNESAALVRAELALERLKQRTRIVDLRSERQEAITKVAEERAKLTQAETELSGKRASLAHLNQVRSGLRDYFETPSTVTNTAAIEQQKDRIAALRNQRAALLVQYKPTHQKVQEIDASISDAERRLAELPRTLTTVTRVPEPRVREYDGKIAEAAGNVAAAQAVVGAARERVAQSAAKLYTYTKAEASLATLEREVAHRTAMVSSLTDSVNSLRLRSNSFRPTVHTVSPAARAKKIAPRRAVNMVIATILGFALGLCFALLQEYLDDRVHSPDDARRMLDAPVLGYIPLVDKEEARLLTGSRGGGSLLESYRVLRSNVQFAAVDNPSASLLVTSTMPGEGKSVTASNLAVAMALDGRKVIIVDSDLRRPTLHHKFGLEQRPGLTNVLVGHMSLEEALQNTHIDNLRVLASGPLPPNPAELLNSRAMRELHEDLKQACKIVIFDSPPVLATADAQVLSAEVDGVVYVAQFGEARKSALRHVSELFNQARANVLGVVFNKIDLTSKRDDYYYGYYRYYNYYTPIEEGGAPSASSAGELPQRRRRRSHAEFDALPKPNAEAIARGRNLSRDEDGAREAGGRNGGNGSGDAHTGDDTAPSSDASAAPDKPSRPGEGA